MTIDELTKSVAIELYRNEVCSDNSEELDEDTLRILEESFESEKSQEALASIQNSYMDLDSYLVGFAIGWKLCCNFRNLLIKRFNEQMMRKLSLEIEGVED